MGGLCLIRVYLLPTLLPRFKAFGKPNGPPVRIADYRCQGMGFG
jgi:hypothetical protein